MMEDSDSTRDMEQQEDIIDDHPTFHPQHSHDAVLSDSEDEDEFIKKYGEIKFQYIRKPKDELWFIRPHALNYFQDGILYRTKGERTSGKMELFLDLLYVGIVANLAGDATEHASGASVLKYLLLFVPSYTVWSDIKDFLNFYYTEDLSQKLYILWILVLLVVYDNNCAHVLDSRQEAAMTVVPYILCRLSLAVSLLVYSLYIPEHRVQMRLYACCILFTCCLWIPVIFISTRAKIGLSIVVMVLEHLSFSMAYHPKTKKLLGLTTSTALNIEHEVERFGAFFIIAVGEFLYKTVAGDPIGAGFHNKLARGICCLIISYCFLWLYFNGGTSSRATHALRRSGEAAIFWIYGHIPLVAGLILAADAAGDLISMENESTAKHTHESDSVAGLERRAEGEEEVSAYALAFFFCGGLCVAILALAILGFAEKSRDHVNSHIVPKFFRIFPRIPVALIILCLAFAELRSTTLIGLATMLMVLLLVWESITRTPKSNLPVALGGYCETVNPPGREQVVPQAQNTSIEAF